MNERKPAEPCLAPRRLRVLVAEDNKDAADTLRVLLEMGGHEVRLAHTGPSALQAARQEAPDALLCDIGLPGMSGYEVARALRADPRFAGVMMVAVTGYADPEHGAQAMAAGFDRHFSKTADPLRLLQELERLAAREPGNGSSRPAAS